MAFPEFIDFQNKKWQVVGKVSGEKVDDHANLRKQWACDLVLKNNQNGTNLQDRLASSEAEGPPSTANNCGGTVPEGTAAN